MHQATTSPIALEALERIAALFAIESSIRGRPPDQRVAARNQYAQPLLEQLKAFLDTSLNRVSGKSALAQAIRYARSRWQALTRYVTDGRLEMSNNAAERAMKPPVLGRNYVQLRIMRSSTARMALRAGRFQGFPRRRTAHNSKALEKSPQLIRRSVPRDFGSEGLQPAEGTLLTWPT